MVSIEVIQGPDKGKVFEVSQSDTVIGRESDGTPLTDGTVSRRHARLVEVNGHWEIADDGSANGTFVNGIRITKPTRLHTGDQIRCGATLLVFEAVAGGAGARLDVDENGRFMEAAIVATVPSSDDSVVLPTPEAGAEAIDNLRILYKLTTEVSSIFNLDQLCQRTIDVIFEVVHADRAFVLLFGEGNRLTVRASRTRGEANGGQMPVSRTIINEVVRQQAGILSSNAMRDKRFSSGKSVHDFGIRSAICVPIKGREKILGVIHVDTSVSNHTYSTEQLRLLTALGIQAGLAIDNGRLHEAAVRSERLTAVGETVAALSHHIKNILQALGGGTELLEKALTEGDAAKASKAWPIVGRGLDRVNAVILNMLAFSKPRPPMLETANVNQVLTECVDLMTPQAEERGAVLMIDLGDLPPMPADPGGLHQAFLNFLTNALDAVEGTEDGVITVRSEFDPLSRQVIIRVIDNGAGMEPEQVGRIFEVFYTTKGHKGTGLGLAVANKVIKEHAGRIDVQSAPGEGTTFTIILPLHPAAPRSSDDTVAP